jgi:predicted kinase
VKVQPLTIIGRIARPTRHVSASLTITMVDRLGAPVLVVLAGWPGTGKTTLGRKLSATLQAAYLRIDSIETAVIRCGLAHPPVGPVGYAVAHEVAASTLSAGVSVVADAVNPVPEARHGWQNLAARTGARLQILKTVLADRHEHRRRVTHRQPDLDGQSVPTWEQVQASGYVAWDEARHGPRVVIDMTDSDEGYRMAMRHLSN